MSYKINDESIIEWGKMKGSPHRDLLKSCNSNYASWILQQGVDFRYQDTRNYIIQNEKNGDVIELRDLIGSVVSLSCEVDLSKHKLLRDQLLGLKEHIANLLD
jgi:hypothetical protein